MSQILALELCGSAIRGVAANLRAGRVVVEQVFTRALAPEGGPSLGQQLSDELTRRGLSRVEVLAVVGRASVELRQFALPPAPDDELPEMVRFQATQEFNELGDDWLLDFVPVSEVGEATRGVLAAAVRPEVSQRLRAACEEAGCHLKRLVLRPCATASLSERIAIAPPDGVRLLVDISGAEAELTVVQGQQLLLARAARLSGDPLAAAEHLHSLIVEIRRTLASVENQTGRTVDRIVLFASSEPCRAAALQMESELAVPSEAVDPFEALPGKRNPSGEVLGDHGGYAPLLGMLLVEADGSSQGIDFLNPRRRPDPPSQRNRYAMIVAAAVVIVAAWFGYRYLDHLWLTDEVAALDAQIKVAKTSAATAKKLSERVKEIEKWTAGDLVWLDELDYLSEHFPPAKEAMLTQLSLAPAQSGGEIKLDGLAQGDAIERMVAMLRNKNHHVVGKESSNDTSRKGYSWRFSASLLIEPEKK